VLDLGCSTGVLGQRLAEVGHIVTGVDLHPSAEAKERLAVFVQADLDHGLPLEAASHGPYDIVVAADVLEHVRDPGRLLDEALPLLAPGGSLVASVPNIGHWYPRSRVAVGRFDYDQRGILDRDHVRFFTRRSFTRLAQRHGWRVVATEATGLPFDVVDRGVQPGLGGALRGLLGWADRAGVKLWPTLFGYQFIVVLEPAEPTARTGARSPAGSPTRRPG
jgi:predicted TPR repeat methyltransferase